MWWDQRVASCQLAPVQLQNRHVRANTAPFASCTAHVAPPPAPLLRSVVVPSCDSAVGRAAVRETRSADDWCGRQKRRANVAPVNKNIALFDMKVQKSIGISISPTDTDHTDMIPYINYLRAIKFIPNFAVLHGPSLKTYNKNLTFFEQLCYLDCIQTKRTMNGK